MKRQIHYVSEMPCPLKLTESKGMAWKNAYCITYRAGNQTHYYINEKSKEPLIHAMRLTAETTGLDFDDIKPTYSAMARQISEWIGSIDSNAQSKEMIPAILPVWHYQKCYPAKVESNLVLVDMTSAYWQIAIHSDTLRIFLCRNGGVIPQRMPKEKALKWDRCREIIGASKPLRLSLIGVNAVTDTSTPRYSYYFRGQKVTPHGTPPTWFTPLSMLTIRIAYELTQMQAEHCNAIYANADAITLQEGDTPELWDYMGIKFRGKAKGAAQINAIGSYKIGDTVTGLFDKRSSPRVLEPTHITPEYYTAFFPKI